MRKIVIIFLIGFILINTYCSDNTFKINVQNDSQLWSYLSLILAIASIIFDKLIEWRKYKLSGKSNAEIEQDNPLKIYKLVKETIDSGIKVAEQKRVKDYPSVLTADQEKELENIAINSIENKSNIQKAVNILTDFHNGDTKKAQSQVRDVAFSLIGDFFNKKRRGK